MEKSYKEQVMQVLTNISSAELSHEAYIWAASHLPDDAEMGTNRTAETSPFKHEAGGILAAFGFKDKEDAQAVLGELDKVREDMIAGEEKPCISMVGEQVLKNYDETGNSRHLRFMMAMFFIRPFEDNPLTDLLRKLMGGDK